MPVGLADRVLALADGVPELDRLIARARDDLPVVDREGHRQHVLGVPQEAARRRARGQVPEPQRAVPGARERELAVGGDDDVLHKVRVAAQRAARVAVGRALLARQVPDDHGLVARRGEDDVRGGVERGRDGGDPAGVALEGAAERERLGHFVVAFFCVGGRRKGCSGMKLKRGERTIER